MNKKLLVTLSTILAMGTLATSTFAATGCTKKSNTTIVDPISDIEVTKPEGDILVGDVIDLDSYVNVVGGLNPKDYTVTARGTTANIVKLEGHKLTILGEGAINLKIEAGEEVSLVSWEAISQLKSMYKAATADVNKNYGLRDVTISQTGSIRETKEFLVHNEEYYYQAYKNQLNIMNGGGAALLHDGYIYDFSADGTEAANNLEFTSEGKEQGLYWEYFFVNMGFGATYDRFDTVVIPAEDDSEEDYEYLEIAANKKVVSGYEDYAGNLADYVTLLTWGSSAKLINKSLIQDGQAAAFDEKSVFIQCEPLSTTTGDTLYLLGSYVKGLDGQTYYINMSILDTEMRIKSIEDYIESEVYPDAIDFSEITSFTSKLAAAKSYKQCTTIYSVTNSGTLYTTEPNLNAKAETVFDDNNKIIYNEWYTLAGAEDGVSGYVEYENTVYSFATDEDTGELAFQAFEYSWSDLTSVASASSWASVGTSGLMATSKKTEGDNVTILATDVSEGGAFVFNLMASLPEISYYIDDEIKDFTQFATMSWTMPVSNETNPTATVTIDIPMNFGDFTPQAVVEYKDLDAVDASDIRAEIIDALLLVLNA